MAERGQLQWIASQDAASENRFLRDTSTELLRTMGEVLDIRAVFPRVSAIVKQVLPHDALALVSAGRDGHVTLEARSVETLPAHGYHTGVDEKEFSIVSDHGARSDDPASEPGGVDALIEAGYHSVLTVRTGEPHRMMRLRFFSRLTDAYTARDLPTARHVADFVAVAVAHERLAAAHWDRAEARGRSAGVVARGRASDDTGEIVPTPGRMIGRSKRWQRVVAAALRVAPTDTTVFLQGESGTGKEVVARFIHQSSPRKRGPFIAINCAALPEQLLESELFGYERGAFTGADRAKAGQIELAAKGVLFLDEVSEMSLAAQAKFLRFLQEREFRRLGGTRTQNANVRLIAASNRDLRQAVQQGTFREDLFYRLQVFDIPLPPLRERINDVPQLAEQFLEDLGEAMGRPPTRLTDDARDALEAHAWPGNVRELRNVLERAAILSDEGLIERHHLSLPAKSATAAASDDLLALERRAIESMMRKCGGNRSKAARQLGLTRTKLYVRLRRYGLEQWDTV
jgi:DNA-binding NtrC family response regulator